MLKIARNLVVYRFVISQTSMVFSLFAIIEVNKFYCARGYWGGGVRRGGAVRGGRGFIRLKPAVHGNYQTKRTDSSAGRESLYINSFCSPTRLFRRRKAKLGSEFFFV